MEVVARETRRDHPAEWVREKIAIVEVAWLNQALEEMTAKLQEERMAQPFYLDPGYQELVDEALRRVSAKAEVEVKVREQFEAVLAKSWSASPENQTTIVCNVEQPNPSPAQSAPSSITASRASSRSVSRLPVRRK